MTAAVTSAPLRLTRRGELVVALLASLIVSALLALAFTAGQDRRCAALHAENSPLTAQYCPPTADLQETR